MHCVPSVLNEIGKISKDGNNQSQIRRKKVGTPPPPSHAAALDSRLVCHTGGWTDCLKGKISLHSS